jgi:hypothetical protein
VFLSPVFFVVGFLLSTTLPALLYWPSVRPPRARSLSPRVLETRLRAALLVLLGNDPLDPEPHTSIGTIRVPSAVLCPPLLSPACCDYMA